jgi:aldose 1-epimerase
VLVTTPSGRQIRLSHADQELTVVEVGGGIRTYVARGISVIDGYDDFEMCSGGRGQLLAPWPNRLGDGCFEWQGRRHQTPLSEPENHNAIHGLVRWLAWTVSSIGEAELRLTCRLHAQPGWPWTLDFEVTYVLGERGLHVRTAIANVSAPELGSCPFGIGWHPYLAAFGGLVDDVLLTIPAGQAYRSDGRGLPTGKYAVEGTGLDFRRGHPVGNARLDTAFTDMRPGLDGRSAIEMVPADEKHEIEPSRGVKLWMDSAYTHVMIYSGDTLGEPLRRRQGLAIEPMTCAPDMLRSGDGRLVLECGHTFDAAWGLEPFSLM